MPIKKPEFEVKNILKVITCFLSDEIDNIHANFFTKFQTHKNTHSLAKDYFKLEEFKFTMQLIFSLNPLTSIHFARKFSYLVRPNNDLQE